MNEITVGFLFVLVLGIVASPLLLQSSYGITSGASENRNDQENIFSYYFGILEFTEDIEGNDNSFGSCSNISTDIKTGTIEINKDSLLTIDNIEDEFFIILSQADSDSYEYLQIALPQKNGNPSYLIDVKKQNLPQLITGGLYQDDYPHLAFVFESDSQISVIDEENHYKKYFAGDSKSIAIPPERLGPGSYDFHAILFQSDRSSGLNGDRCAISLNWEFSVDGNGGITTKPPQTKTGIISDATEKFSPLKQYKMGVEASNIECKKGYRLLEQEDYSDNKRIACVTPETKTQLIKRGWANNTEIDDNLESVPINGFTPTEVPLHENQEANELKSYRDAKSSGTISIPTAKSPHLSDKDLDELLDKLRRSGLPIAMSAIDYGVGVIVIWTPDLGIGEKFKTELGDVPFVLLHEEAPPRW